MDREHHMGRLDPRGVETYTVREVAHYLRLPPTTVHQWFRGRGYGTNRYSRPVIAISREQRLLTFWNLAEAYVLAGIRREHRVSLKSIRCAVQYVEREMHTVHPLVHQEFQTDGIDLFTRKLGEEERGLINASRGGQLAMADLLRSVLRRVNRDTSGLISAIRPWFSDAKEAEEVEVNPLLCFGRLVVIGTRVPTEVISDRYRAGDTIPALAEDFVIPAARIEHALRWEGAIQ